MDAREIYVDAIRQFYLTARSFNYTEQQADNFAQIHANNEIGRSVIQAFAKALPIENWREMLAERDLQIGILRAALNKVTTENTIDSRLA